MGALQRVPALQHALAAAHGREDGRDAFEEAGELVDAVDLIGAGGALSGLRVGGADHRPLALEPPGRLVREEQVRDVLATATVDDEVGVRRLDGAQVLEVVDLPETRVRRLLRAALEDGDGVGRLLTKRSEQGGAAVTVFVEGDHGPPTEARCG